jgi:predicted transposase/invertase (TIGR01784 family)
LGKSVLQLVTISDELVPGAVERVVSEVRKLTDESFQRQVIELVERMLVYRFPDFSREVLQAMFTDADLKKTRFYREAFQEGLEEGLQEGRLDERRQLIVRLRQRGFSQQEVMEMLELSLEQVTESWDR